MSAAGPNKGASSWVTRLCPAVSKKHSQLITTKTITKVRDNCVHCLPLAASAWPHLLSISLSECECRLRLLHLSFPRTRLLVTWWWPQLVHQYGTQKESLFDVLDTRQKGPIISVKLGNLRLHCSNHAKTLSMRN